MCSSTVAGLPCVVVQCQRYHMLLCLALFVQICSDLDAATKIKLQFEEKDLSCEVPSNLSLIVTKDHPKCTHLRFISFSMLFICCSREIIISSCSAIKLFLALIAFSSLMFESVLSPASEIKANISCFYLFYCYIVGVVRLTSFFSKQAFRKLKFTTKTLQKLTLKLLLQVLPPPLLLVLVLNNLQSAMRLNLVSKKTFVGFQLRLIDFKFVFCSWARIDNLLALGCFEVIHSYLGIENLANQKATKVQVSFPTNIR